MRSFVLAISFASFARRMAVFFRIGLVARRREVLRRVGELQDIDFDRLDHLHLGRQLGEFLDFVIDIEEVGETQCRHNDHECQNDTETGHDPYTDIQVLDRIHAYYS